MGAFRVLSLCLALGTLLACSPPLVQGLCERDSDCKSPQLQCIQGYCACRDGLAACGSECVDLSTHPAHCGSCTQACKTGQLCRGGRCACPPQQSRCQGACVDLQRSSQHCGRCGFACPQGQRCAEGECVEGCPAATPDTCTTSNGPLCVDLNADDEHCGACEKACSKGQICVRGACVCPPGWRGCKGVCVDPLSDRLHCGKCERACGEGRKCASGRCVQSCPKSTPTACFGGCFDTQTHPLHCGACGNACPRGQRCVEGRCQCVPGAAVCLSQGQLNGCVDLRSSNAHCGVCQHPCAKGQRCAQGQCLPNCPKSTPTSCFGGCFDTQTHAKHCGACGKACGDLQRCVAGKCQCPKGMLLCDGKCWDPHTSPLHCTKCGQLCPDGQLCTAKGCQSTCPPDTPTTCHGGCHDLQSSDAHCGACGKACAGGQSCQKGSCACPSGQRLCDGLCVDLQVDRLHCGKCGTFCRPGLACVQGKCLLDCGDLSFCGGLCIDPSTDDKHCGACNNSCKGEQRCIAGKCSCPPGTQACGDRCFNLQDDEQNCGKCGHSCTARKVCVQGQCRLVCSDPKLTGCDEGCVDLQTHSQHCGGCKKACQPGQSCQAGSCSCPAQQRSCGGQCVDTHINPAHCGKCNNPCQKGYFCSNGACQHCSGEAPISCGSTCCRSHELCCQGACINPKTDPSHCGGCQKACTTGQRCHNGACRCIDNDTRPCYTGPPATADKGQCKRGTQTCSGGTWSSQCTGEIKPSAEICDGKDNDCDGNIDEDFPTKGKACAAGKGSCRRTGLFSCNAKGSGVECSVKAGAPQSEVCDGQDNDCDGQVDEGLSQSCYSGPKGTSGTAPCKAGTQTCSAGSWGACKGQVTPSAELCDGKDNDCDGNTDEGCACQNGQTRPCGTNVGICKAGVQTCTRGTWGSCNGSTSGKTEVCDGLDNDCDGKTDEDLTPPPCARQKGVCKGALQLCQKGANGTQWQACTAARYRQHSASYQASETSCDNKDNDCDGSVDEGLSRACYTGPAATRSKGTCKDGTQTCSAGKWGLCVGEIKPTAEVCDNKDNDCDGSVDEGLSQACYTGPNGTAGRGLCRQGSQTCAAGKWGLCVGEIKPTAEVCDNKDNDCDGTVDEGLSRACYTGSPASSQGKGICKAGTQTCSRGSWGSCVGEVTPRTETCDGTDDDCDGQIDEGCSCQNGQTRACGSEIGECVAGVQTCSNGSWGSCVGEVKPTAEICNAKDDDCDGSADEGLSRACYSGPAATRNKGLCKDGTQTCTSGSWGACVGEITPKSETCDNKDNDCDGSVDEGLSQSCYSGPKGTSGKGICKAGTQTCSAGSWGSCNGEVTPQAEVCNNKDDDCDGQIDESLSQSCYNGPKGTSGTGRCTAGIQTCSRGSWGPCAGEVLPRTETCDGTDDDCDGQIDEGCSCQDGQTRACGSSTGECRQGTQTCSSGRWGSCTGEVTPQPEVCDNKDNDCDGQVDESLSQSCYTGPQGTSGVGLCQAGTQTCSAGQWGSCVGEITPQPEVCDNKDNDCDGDTDEGLSRSCYTGPQGTSGVGECRNGNQTCAAGSWGTCSGEITPVVETCDGKDNDCDGQVDEGLEESAPPCSEQSGVCSSARKVCQNGAWQPCKASDYGVAYSTSDRLCDGRDNDCDGQVDEDCRACAQGFTYDDTLLSSSPLSQAAVDPLGAQVLGSSTRGVLVWNIQTKQLSRTLSAANAIADVAYNPNEHTAALCLSSRLDIHNVLTGGLVRSITVTGPRAVAYSPDGSKLVVASSDKKLYIYNASTGQLLHTLTGHTQAALDVAWSLDGSFIASGSSDGSVIQWNANNGALLHRFQSHTGAVNSVAISPNSRVIASAGEDRTVQAHDVNTRQRLWSHPGTQAFMGLAYYYDGNRLFAGHNTQLRVLNASTGAALQSLTHSPTGRITSIATSPDGKTVFSVHASINRLKIWTCR